MADTLNKTQPVGSRTQLSPAVRRFRLVVLEGPDTGTAWESTDERCSIGQERGNELVLTDTTVSRFHCELEATDHGVRLKDLGSLNGVLVDGVHVLEGYLKSGSTLRLGRTVLRFDFAHEPNPLKLSAHDRFGRLQGTSVGMRATFHLMERAAASDVTVLFEGETGTGKSQAARAIHQASARKDGPFLTLDCGALPAALMESELFGHERGAFTGADLRRVGIFEEAKGGTVFLDEIGELPLELQPKLLHVLENREVRRVGANAFLPVDVRLVAATHRDLRLEVNAGRFRADLFYRLAVLRVPLLPLRQHVEDLPAIVNELLNAMGVSPELRARFTEPAFLTRLGQLAWPGNVRELRNYLERCVVFEEVVAPTDQPAASNTRVPIDVSLPWAEARKRAIDTFERDYTAALLAAHDGNVTRASSAAEMDRAYLHRLMRRSRSEG
ncbi:MAG: sigma 54-interacting transcriptional regulator [Archangium sp.]|nr:sigma 54-interacting transcriptional regulator [Archangium sp.]